ncbi:31080_t:CDS:1, partial [Gigaspora margarita]
LHQGQVKISTSSYRENTTIKIEKTKQNNLNQLVEKKLPGLSAERQ